MRTRTMSKPWEYIESLEAALEAACSELASLGEDHVDQSEAWWRVTESLTVCGWCGQDGPIDAAVGVIPLHHGNGRDCYWQAQRAWRGGALDRLVRLSEDLGLYDQGDET